MRKIEVRPTTWIFRLKEKIGLRTQITLEEHTSFWAEQLKTWFYGYKTPDPVKATIWGRNVDLEIRIAPPGTPTETLPVIPTADCDSQSLSADKRERIKGLKAKIAGIKASIPCDPDEALENRYWNYLDRELFSGSYRQAVAVWNRESDLVIRNQQIGELFVKMYDSIRDLKLPDELMRNDTKFHDMLVQILLFVEKVETYARMNNVILPPKVHELSVFLDHFSDLLIEGGNKLFGIKREMTDEQRNEAASWVTAAFDSARPVDERLEILNRLCDNPLVDTDDRLSFLDKSIELIQQGIKRPKPALCPYDELIRRHLSGIGRYLQKLEQNGCGVWRQCVAEEMFDSLKVWREDAGMLAWSKEEFAEMLDPASLTVSSHEQENGDIDYQLELFFFDKEDSFAGHMIYISVKNEAVNEILLMG